MVSVWLQEPPVIADPSVVVVLYNRKNEMCKI